MSQGGLQQAQKSVLVCVNTLGHYCEIVLVLARSTRGAYIRVPGTLWRHPVTPTAAHSQNFLNAARLSDARGKVDYQVKKA